jgi:glutamine amidotransferase PdxT
LAVDGGESTTIQRLDKIKGYEDRVRGESKEQVLEGVR